MIKTWQEALKPILETKEFKDLKEKIKKERETKEILPNPKSVFNIFKYTPYDKLKIIIIGQDPYSDPKHYMGLAFSSAVKETPGSLKNIFKEIYRDLKPEETSKEFFPSNDLSGWAQQGVLLLNAILTVEAWKSDSHENIGWELFTEKVIKILNNYDKPLVFMLWGNKAKQYKQFIVDEKHLILETSHPNDQSVDLGFDGCGHFGKALEFLKFREPTDMVFDFNPYFDMNSALYDLEVKYKHSKKFKEDITTVIKNNLKGKLEVQWYEQINFSTKP